jgi:hypothetical protein
VAPGARTPLAEAVRAVWLFPRRWRPADEHGRVLFGLLWSISPRQLETGLAALAAAGAVHLRTTRGPVMAGALSVDGKRLAIVTWPRTRGMISVFDLAGGTMTAQHRVGSPPFALLAYAGDTLVMCNADHPDHPGSRLLRELDGRLEPFPGINVTPHEWPVTGLAPVFHPAGGFAVLCGFQVTFYDADRG